MVQGLGRQPGRPCSSLRSVSPERISARLVAAGHLAHGSVIYGLAFTADGTRLATGCADNTIRLWDIATGTEVAELRGHAGFVHAVAFSSDGTRLASASGDLTARVWDSLSIQVRDRASRGQPIHRDDRARAR